MLSIFRLFAVVSSAISLVRGDGVAQDLDKRLSVGACLQIQGKISKASGLYYPGTGSC